MNPTIAALERLAVKQGVTLGNLNRSDLQVVLALASLCLSADATFAEPEVNVALKAWLASTGAMLHVDHVELRRTLIDVALWERDGFGHAYRRAMTFADAELATHVAELSALNPQQLIAARRAEHAAERAQRKILGRAQRTSQAEPGPPNESISASGAT